MPIIAEPLFEPIIQEKIERTQTISLFGLVRVLQLMIKNFYGNCVDYISECSSDRCCIRIPLIKLKGWNPDTKANAAASPESFAYSVSCYHDMFLFFRRTVELAFASCTGLQAISC